jgi:hypothetical protein
MEMKLRWFTVKVPYPKTYSEIDKMKLLQIFTNLILIIFLFVSKPLKCDDAVYRGDGVNVYPISSEQIKLVSETIKITVLYQKDWMINVTMNFKNTGDSTTVQMGFPFTSDEFNPNFSVFDGTEKLTVIKKKAVKKPHIIKYHFPIVYTFMVHFAKGEEKTMYHTYWINSLHPSLGISSNTYILQTGALWKESIDLIDIILTAPIASVKYFNFILPKENEAIREGDKIILKWNYENIEPDFNLEIGSMPTRYFNIFKESPDLFLETVDEQIRRGPIHFDQRFLRYIRNMIYAYYGYPFKNPLMQAQFYDSGMFSEVKNFSVDKFSEKHKALLKLIVLIED